MRGAKILPLRLGVGVRDLVENMDKRVAQGLIDAELKRLRRCLYADLVEMIGRPQAKKVVGGGRQFLSVGDPGVLGQRKERRLESDCCC
jgi:hypothetical protein